MKPILGRAGHRHRPNCCGKCGQVDRLGRQRFGPLQITRRAGQRVPHHLAPHGVCTGGGQPSFEQRELLDKFLFREPFGPQKTTHNRTQEPLDRRLVGETKFLAYDRLEHLIDRRTSPCGEPVLSLKNKCGQFVHVVQLSRRVSRQPRGFRE